MAIPQEVIDFLELVDQQGPFVIKSEDTSQDTPPHILVETALRCLSTALKRAESNPRLLNLPRETAKKLRELAEQFDKVPPS